jgi:hypothetical protein
MGIALLDIHQDELMLLSMEDMLKVCIMLTFGISYMSMS